jgi:DNA-binding NarL/FixJ family response regulator
LIRRHQPQIVVLDLDMPRLDGFAVARRMREERLPAGIIILTMHQDEMHFNEALNLGAKGYLVKDSAAADVVNCIKSVAAGHSYISATLSGLLLNRGRRAAAPPPQPTGFDSLTSAGRQRPHRRKPPRQYLRQTRSPRFARAGQIRDRA